jgi:hypothetical protein
MEEVLIPGRGKVVSLFHHVQIGSDAHTASYQMKKQTNSAKTQSCPFTYILW